MKSLFLAFFAAITLFSSAASAQYYRDSYPHRDGYGYRNSPSHTSQAVGALLGIAAIVAADRYVSRHRSYRSHHNDYRYAPRYNYNYNYNYGYRPYSRYDRPVYRQHSWQHYDRHHHHNRHRRGH
jgi:hypothetical protein